MENATLGRQLRKYRERSGLTQEQVAKHLNIQRQAYSNYERGTRTPDPKTLTSIAALFHISMDELLQPDMLRDSGRPEYCTDGSNTVSNNHILLTGTEVRLIKDYRSLNEAYQEDFLDYMKYLKFKSENAD